MRRSRSRSRSRAPEDHSRIQAYQPMPSIHSQKSLQDKRNQLLINRLNQSSSNVLSTPRPNGLGSLRNALGHSAPVQRSAHNQRPADPRISSSSTQRPNVHANRPSVQTMSSQRRPVDPRIQQNQRPNMPSNSASTMGVQTPQLGPIQRMKMTMDWRTQKPNWCTQPPTGDTSAGQIQPSPMANNVPLRHLTTTSGQQQQRPQQQPQVGRSPAKNIVPSPPQMSVGDEDDNVLPHNLLPEYENSNENNSDAPPNQQRRPAIHSDDDDEEDDGHAAAYAQPTAKRGRIESGNNTTSNNNSFLFEGPSTSAAAAASVSGQAMVGNNRRTNDNWVDTQKALGNDIRTYFAEANEKYEMCNEFMRVFSLVITAIKQGIESRI